MFSPRPPRARDAELRECQLNRDGSRGGCVINLSYAQVADANYVETGIPCAHQVCSRRPTWGRTASTATLIWPD